MSGKVFISCGQALDEERAIAREVKYWLSSQGFFPYVAIEAQSIQDINSAIISELKSSDYYVFIDFPRENLPSDCGEIHRGSLFTNQELALAYILGFERVLFLQYEKNKREGLLNYMASNAIRFSTHEEVIGRIKDAFINRGWLPGYTRHLVATNLRFSEQLIRYGSHSTHESIVGRFLYVDINNKRSDLAAFSTVARLSSIKDCATDKYLPALDMSHLKATGHPTYSQIIFPNSHGAFDLLVVRADSPGQVCLNSSLDVIPKPSIINKVGEYQLSFEVLAEAFPILLFMVHLRITDDPLTATAELVPE